MMKIADLVVKSSDDNVVLVVEVKARSQVSDEWASTLHRNLLVHGLVPNSAYFLLALPDFFYLWNPGRQVRSDKFDYKVPSQKILSRYLDKDSLPALSGSSLELVLSAWLGDIMNSVIRKDEYPEFNWIFESGLYLSIKGGAVQAQAVI
jgi:hypothetical protein